MSFESWPWWLGALVMSASVLGLIFTTGRAFGASGFWSRALSYKTEQELKKAEDLFSGDAEAFQRALLAATLEEFGPLPVPVSDEEIGAGTTPVPLEPAPVPVEPAASPDAAPESREEPDLSASSSVTTTTVKKKRRRTKAGLKQPKKKHKKKPGNRRSAKRKR